MIQDFGDSRRGALCQKGSLTIGLLCPGGGDSSRSTLVPSQSRPGIDRRPGCVARALVHVTTRYVGLHQARRFPRAQLGRLPRYGNQAGYLLTYWLIQKKKKKLLCSRPCQSRLDIRDRDPTILSRLLLLVLLLPGW